MSSLMPKLSPFTLQQQLRRVTVNQAVSARAYSSFYPKIRVESKVPAGHRSLQTTKHQNSVHDEATIDFAYMPQDSLAAPPESETLRVPLLPDNVTPPLEHTNNAHHDVHMQPVSRPQIHTVSADSTHIDSPSAMSEVMDNHTIDVDVFDLTRKVKNAAAVRMSEVAIRGAEEVEKQRGLVGDLVNGMMDDVFGPKRAA